MYVRSDGLAGVVIADTEYPQRVCFTLLDKVSAAGGGSRGALGGDGGPSGPAPGRERIPSLASGVEPGRVWLARAAAGG